jgi:hypothetical protein
VHETARAVAAVAVINAQRVAGKSPFFHAHGFFDALPQMRLAEDLRAIGAHSRAATGRAHAAGRILCGHVIGVQGSSSASRSVANTPF